MSSRERTSQRSSQSFSQEICVLEELEVQEARVQTTSQQSTQFTSQEVLMYARFEEEALEDIRQRGARKQTSATTGPPMPPSQVTSQEARLYEEMERQALEDIRQRDARKGSEQPTQEITSQEMRAIAEADQVTFAEMSICEQLEEQERRKIGTRGKRSNSTQSFTSQEVMDFARMEETAIADLQALKQRRRSAEQELPSTLLQPSPPRSPAAAAPAAAAAAAGGGGDGGGNGGCVTPVTAFAAAAAAAASAAVSAAVAGEAGEDTAAAGGGAKSPSADGKGKGKRRCGKCGVEGHNITTCGREKKTSGVRPLALVSKTPSPTRAKASASASAPSASSSSSLAAGEGGGGGGGGGAGSCGVAADIAMGHEGDGEVAAAAAAAEAAEAAPREPTLGELGLCACKGQCSNGRCACRRRGALCNPRYCRCCSGLEALCLNVGALPPHFSAHREPLPEITALSTVGLGVGGVSEYSLIVASWNIMSFGHNMYWEPSGGGGPRRLSSVFLATIQKVVGFIDAHDVDLMFIQETIDAEALAFLVGQLNCYKLEWIPTLVDIGQGFNRSKPSVRPMEMAAVVYKDASQFNPPPCWSIAQALSTCDHPVSNQHEAITELRDRFKRLPAFMTIKLNTSDELLCLVTVHLPSDSQLQSLRLDAEIATLPALAEGLKQSTGASSVVLLGDFNRNPDTVAFSALTATHWPAILPKAGVRTNIGKEPHVYDNFFIPRGLWSRSRACIGTGDWMELHLRRDPEKKASDHFPILLAIRGKEEDEGRGERGESEARRAGGIYS